MRSSGVRAGRHHRYLAATLLAGLVLLIAGCAGQPSPDQPTRHTSQTSRSGGGSSSGGGGYYQNDGPPDNENIDWSTVENAVPRNAPRSEYGNPDSYTALGSRYYVLDSARGFTQRGRASWYGRQFHGRRTSSGEPYNMFSMTAAHKRLPIPSWVEVTNLENGRRCIVKVNDRGPFRPGRIIDLSYVAARRLGIVRHGSAPVRIRTVTPDDYRRMQAGNRNADTPQRAAIPLRQAGNRRPDTAPEPTASSRPATPESMLQVGAFAEHANAADLKQRILAQGIRPVVIVPPSANLDLFRVRVGPFTDRRRRDGTARKLAASGYPVRLVKR